MIQPPHATLQDSASGLPGGSCVVVKLGGSLITLCENGQAVTNRELVTACASELAASGKPVVLVHGTGTFGKPPAIRYGYLDGHLSAERSDVVAHVSLDLAKLEMDVLESLAAGGLRPLRLSTSALFRLENGHVVCKDPGLIRDLLVRGITPVLGGHFIIDPLGFSVCSSDTIAVDLAVALQASTLALLTNAHGVYRDFGNSDAIYHELSLQDGPQLAALDGATHDVSGGMKSKVSSCWHAVENGIPSFILDGRLPGNLTNVFAGRMQAGTRLVYTTPATAPANLN